MKALKSLVVAKSSKGTRERLVLMALIDYHLRTGKPVGSHALKEANLLDLSSATIRNYFADLEKEGYLTQQHASGGRLPTDRAYRLYAQEHCQATTLLPEHQQVCELLRLREMREINTYLQDSAEILSRETGSAVFLSAPRFDHDFIVGMRLLAIDSTRCLCIIITDFGVIKTELLHIEHKLTNFTVKRLEEYFHWRLTGLDKPENLEHEELMLAQRIYNELMVRYLVGYSNFTDEEIYRTGFSKLLAYAEFQEGNTLASSLALFENSHSMRRLAKECFAHDDIKFWIGSDLDSYTRETPHCTLMAIPYRVNHQPVGVIGLLAPMRMPYRETIAMLRALSQAISESLTRSLYKFKIKYRMPEENLLLSSQEEQPLIDKAPLFLLENHTFEGLHQGE